MSTSTKEQRREYNRRYRERHPERVAAASKRWRDENPERGREYARRQRERDAEACSARQALNKAVYRGEVVKPDHCEECGGLVEARNLHGHHADYDKPLEVEWLCEPCHRGRHRG